MSSQPYVPASKSIAEITFISVALGLVLAAVMSAANVYLGLYAGLTVSASIPAAVISMGLLRGVLRRGTILENNIVQTIASTGESLAAGVIFTIPALMLTGLWDGIKFWPTTLIAVSGGMLGILFMIPLRKSHVVEDKELAYPEGVACAQVLKAGEEGGQGAKYLAYSMVVGAFMKFFTSGVSIFKGSVEWVGNLFGTGWYFGTDVSAALLGVGYIIRLNVAALVFIGGAIGWIIGIPAMGWVDGAPGPSGELMDWFWGSWSTKIRYVGVGAMIVGGVWSIVSIWDGMIRGFKEALVGYKGAGQDAAKAIRTEVAMKQSHTLILFGLTTILVFMIYRTMITDLPATIISTILGIILSFFFVAVASYIVGLVGSSSSPVSGMTICAVLATGGLMFILGKTGTEGMLATLGVAAVVCCATCTSGDISQDLKTGYLVGATPRKQQWMEVVGATIPSLVLAPTLVVLHSSYGIGTGLKAPQATLFASLAKGLFGDGQIPWNFVFWGIGIGVLIVICDVMLKARKAPFRMPIMAVAVGIYLPLTLSTPIILGGLISHWASSKSETDKGTLFASGLIAGEALLGVIIATIIFFMNYGNQPGDPKWSFPTLISSDFVSILGLAGLAYLLFRVAKKR